MKKNMVSQGTKHIKLSTPTSRKDLRVAGKGIISRTKRNGSESPDVCIFIMMSDNSKPF